MAFYDNQLCFTLPAAGALTQYTFVSVDTNGRAANTSAAEMPDGVVQNDPSAQGDAAEIADHGLVQVLAGEGISQGDDIGVGSSGKARTTTTGDAIVGRAVTAASGDGSVFTMHIQPTSRDAA